MRLRIYLYKSLCHQAQWMVSGYNDLMPCGPLPSVGHMHHLMCSQNGPVTEIFNRFLPSGSSWSSEGQICIWSLNSAMMEANIKCCGSTWNRGQGWMAVKERFLKWHLSRELKVDLELPKWRGFRVWSIPEVDSCPEGAVLFSRDPVCFHYFCIG